MNNKIIARLFLSVALIFPCFLWVCLDKSAWFWDPAMYGLEAIRLWRYLIFQPSGYFHNLFTVIGTKAPMICWIGQFFAPFGNWFGYERALLFMQVFFSAWMIFDVTRWKIFSSSPLKMLLGALLVASTPVFIFQSHFYFVELSQAFGVLFTFGLYLRRKEVSVVYITCAYFTLFFYLLGVKITSPCYIFLPTLGLLHECWIRRKEYAWHELKIGRVKLWFILAIITTITVSIWYITNAMAIYHFAMGSARGKTALLYGQKAGLITKFKFWWPNMRNLFWGGRTQIIFEALLIFGLIVNWRSWRKIVDQPFCFAVGQVALILLAVCLQINQETRYIYPLLVYWVYIFGRILVQKKWIMLLALIVLLFRCTEINLGTLNVWPLNMWMPWSDKVDTKGLQLNQANLVLEKIVDRKNQKAILLGIDIRQMNENLLQFIYFTQHHDAVLNYPIYSIGYAQNSVTQSLQNIKNLHGIYVITLPSSDLKKLNDSWNQVSLELAVSLEKSGWRTFSPGTGYFILKNPKES